MMTYHLAMVLLVFSFSLTGSCQKAALYVYPSPFILTPAASDGIGDSVLISCQSPVLASGESLLELSVTRLLHSSSNVTLTSVPIATATRGSEDGQAKLLPTELAAMVSGDIDRAAINLTITHASCRDAGTYSCNAIVLQTGNGLGVSEFIATTALTVIVSPGNIIMIAVPSGKTSWMVGELLVLTCHGIVGSVDNTSQIQWIWEYVSSDNSSWETYDGSLSDIRTSDLQLEPLSPHHCYKRQTSTLTRQLITADSGREYRCYPLNAALGDLAVPISGQTFSVGRVVAKDEDDTTALLTAVVVLAVVLGVFVLVAIILFIWLWKRQWILPCKEKPDAHGSFHMVENDTQEMTVF